MMNWLEELKDYIEEAHYMMTEGRETARLRLSAHRLALKENRVSPYTHPNRYDSLWRPL